METDVQSWADNFRKLSDADQIKGGTFIEMDDIGHFPMSENYPVFKKYLQQALDQIAQGAG